MIHFSFNSKLQSTWKIHTGILITLIMPGKIKCCSVYLLAKTLSAGVDWLNVHLRKYPYRQGTGTYIITITIPEGLKSPTVPPISVKFL